MDQQSAIEIWAILRNFTESHPHSIVLLTTHEMTEAEALGSTIVFLKKGKVRALGSLEELTEQFQIGYSIIFSNDKHEDLIYSMFPQVRFSVLDFDNLTSFFFFLQGNKNCVKIYERC